MSALGHIGREIEKSLITAIVKPGSGLKLLKALAEAPGVLSVSHHHARGVGKRRMRTGQLFSSERDVLIVLTEAEHADSVFDRVFREGHIGELGTGMVFMEKILRGHPMMPLDLADW